MPIEFTIHRFPSLDSTNNMCMQMAEDGAAEGTVVIAEKQTAGRGRMGRHWVSPPGGGMYLSLLVKPNIPLEKLWHISFVTSLAGAEAVEKVCGIYANVKWPNDVLLNSRKVSGILIESKSCGKDKSPAVVIGIGITVNIREFPADFMQKATSLALESGREIPISDIEESFLDIFNARYSNYLAEGFSPTLSAWRERDATKGRAITAHTPSGTVTGVAVEIDDAGNLIVEDAGGSATVISSGDVILQRQ